MGWDVMRTPGTVRESPDSWLGIQFDLGSGDFAGPLALIAGWMTASCVALCRIKTGWTDGVFCIKLCGT